jgi:PAS domain S-box-containing protein
MKILIVDDHPANLRLLRAQLEAEGHDVVDAANGAEALRRLDAESVDGMISDILMPEMDGYRLCQEVRKRETLFTLPVVLYTSTYNSPGDRLMALKSGADAYLTKPAPIPKIVAALSEAVRKPRRAQPIESAVSEGDVLKAYSAALVRKLEDRKLDLEHTVAEIKRALEAARREDGLYRLAFEHLPAGVILADRGGGILAANARVAEMLGYAAGEEALDALRADTLVFVDPQARDFFWSALRQDGKLNGYCLELRRADGSSLPVRLDGRRIGDQRDQAGLLVGLVTAAA